MRLILRADEHYKVLRFGKGDARYDQVRFLACRFCTFRVDVVALHRNGDKSGAGRYCRARGAMVKHLHGVHAAQLFDVVRGE